MLEHHPLRRDPRVLVAFVLEHRLRYLALDAWECVALGDLPRGRRGFALFTLLLRVRPSHVALVGGREARALRRTLMARGVAVLPLSLDAARRLLRRGPTLAELGRKYAELRGVNLRPFRSLLRLAAALLLEPLPPRPYVSRLPPRASAPVAPRRSLSDPSPPGAAAPPTRRASLS